jgi:hypothetical protein
LYAFTHCRWQHPGVNYEIVNPLVCNIALAFCFQERGFRRAGTGVFIRKIFVLLEESGNLSQKYDILDCMTMPVDKLTTGSKAPEISGPSIPTDLIQDRGMHAVCMVIYERGQ